MLGWVTATESILRSDAEARRVIDDIRAEFARCNLSRLDEFNSVYYTGRNALGIATEQNEPPAEAVAAQLALLELLHLEIQADGIRGTQAQIEAYGADNSSCSAGDANEVD